MKIAVVGAGISGLGASVILSRQHDVHLFESGTRLGGHAHTVRVESSGRSIPMDVGFLVFNELNYPHLTAFFRYLGVQTVDSDMSLSVRNRAERLEWGGQDLNTVFGQRRNLFRPSFHRMLLEILRFHRESESNLALARRHGWSLRELLHERDYAAEFARNYLLPMGAAIWSTPEMGMLDYPADTLLTFFMNHRLLQVEGRLQWKTVNGGSIKYVEKAKEQVAHVHVQSEVLGVERGERGVTVVTGRGASLFDRVVLATHAPVSARLLQGQSETERRILGTFRVEPNSAVLHSDPSAMPQTRRCWSAWNVSAGDANRAANLTDSLADNSRVSLTYHLNRLQPLATENDFFLTLNPDRKLAQVHQEFAFAHPRFDRTTIRMQRELSQIQGRGGVYFAGAWTRYGFHEDGLQSAVQVAELIGSRPPWEVK